MKRDFFPFIFFLFFISHHYLCISPNKETPDWRRCTVFTQTKTVSPSLPGSAAPRKNIPLSLTQAVTELEAALDAICSVACTSSSSSSSSYPQFVISRTTMIHRAHLHPKCCLLHLSIFKLPDLKIKSVYIWFAA